MANNYNTPNEVFRENRKAGEGKSVTPLVKCILLGLMAGGFIAIGAAASSVAAHNIPNQGLARAVMGAIFPVGLMMIVLIGGELFTGDCMMIAGVMDRLFSVKQMLRTLVIVWLANLVGAVLIAVLVYFSGMYDFTDGMLGAYTIKIACSKCTIDPLRAVCSGVLCNILVCAAVLMSTAARDIAGKVWAIFFPICAFVIAGWEHCVANMYYIPAGILASMNENYAARAQELYGLTQAQLESVSVAGFLANEIPVTIGNIIGGMLFVALPLHLIHKEGDGE